MMKAIMIPLKGYSDFCICLLDEMNLSSRIIIQNYEISLTFWHVYALFFGIRSIG